MKLTITGVCDVGCVRDTNEDMILMGAALVRDGRGRVEWSSPNAAAPPLLAVADGLGGANAGEVASQFVLERLRDGMAGMVWQQEEHAVVSAIRRLCQAIHAELLAAGASDPARAGMGTTLIALLFQRDPPLLINAGDSRLYRYRGGILTQLSRDHSLRAASGNAQVPANIVVNSFGGGQTFHVDVEPAGKRVFAGDVFLLCSDGISDALDDSEIEAILGAPGAEDALLAAAKRNGGRDNISYVLVSVQDA